MPNPNRKLALVLATASGLATMAGIHLYVSGREPAVAAPLAPMVITAQAVGDTRPLEAGDLKIVMVPVRPTGTFATPGELIGRLPLVAVPSGQPLLSSHLAAPGTKPGLLHRIPNGKRAITVGLDEVVGVGGFLAPGLRVDVLAVTRKDGDWGSRTVVQDVPILAVAQDDAHAEADQTKPRLVRSATLLVSPEQAEAVSLAGEEGRIRLVLRAQDDHTLRRLAPAPRVVKAKAAKLKPRTVARAHAPRAASAPRPRAPEPAKPARPKPAPAPGIEVIHGMNAEVVNP